MIHNNPSKPSLLTNTELEWLLGKIQLQESYHRKIKSQIRKKIENFEKVELPLLVEKGLLSLSTVTKFGNGVTKSSNTENDYYSKTNDKNQQSCAHMKSLGRDFPCDSTLLDSRPFPYQE